jgi:hypothetical protein
VASPTIPAPMTATRSGVGIELTLVVSASSSVQNVSIVPPVVQFVYLLSSLFSVG